MPQRAGVEIPSKPLLMHWMAALVSIVAGSVNEFSVRLPSAGLAIAGVIVCYFYVRRLFDDVTALIAALILATTFQYLQAATGARVDMTLTFFMQVAFFEFILMAEGLTRRRMLLYVAIALAVLTKGPIGLILPGLVALIWIALEKRWSFLQQMSLFRGALVVLVLARLPVVVFVEHPVRVLVVPLVGDGHCHHSPSRLMRSSRCAAITRSVGRSTVSSPTVGTPSLT